MSSVTTPLDDSQAGRQAGRKEGREEGRKGGREEGRKGGSISH
jgi:hypothetical protein